MEDGRRRRRRHDCGHRRLRDPATGGRPERRRGRGLRAALLAVRRLDGRRVRELAARIEAEEMAKTDRLAASTGLFQPKGEIGLDLLLF